MTGATPRIEVRLVRFRPPFPLYLTEKAALVGFFAPTGPSSGTIHLGVSSGGLIYESANAYFNALWDESTRQRWADVMELQERVEADMNVSLAPRYEIHVRIPTPDGSGRHASLTQKWKLRKLLDHIGDSSQKVNVFTFDGSTIEKVIDALQQDWQGARKVPRGTIVEIEEILYQCESGAQCPIRAPAGRRSPAIEGCAQRFSAIRDYQVQYDVHFSFTFDSKAQKRNLRLLHEICPGAVSWSCASDANDPQLIKSKCFDSREELTRFGVHGVEAAVRQAIMDRRLPVSLKVVVESVLYRGDLPSILRANSD